MDYANKSRLKILGRVRIVDASDTLKRLSLPVYRAQIERGMLITVEGIRLEKSENITQRVTLADVEAVIEPLRRRLEELESALHQRGD